MLKNKNVYIIGPTFQLEHVFPKYGYVPYIDNRQGKEPSNPAKDVLDLPESDIGAVCWTGGADISPELYNQQQLECTYANPNRDDREVKLYRKFKALPKLGICRGAQLINVMNGGGMYQDVDNHESGVHPVHDVVTGKSYVVCSVHHQMMIPSDNAFVVAYANRATKRVKDDGEFPIMPGDIDPEVLWIEEDQALLFQGHPEFGPKTCTDYFFELVERYMK